MAKGKKTRRNQKKKAKKQRTQVVNLATVRQVPKRRRNRRRNGKSMPGMVGVASTARNMMRPMRSMTASDGHMCRFKGTDFLTAVTIGGTNAAAGDVLYTAVVNPKTLGVSRLATVSTLWERYKFRSLKFRYSPVAPTTTAGQLIGYVDYDTYDDPTGISGPQNLQRAAAHYGEKPVQVWQGDEKPVFWEIKDVDPLTDLYVDSDGTDPRWTNQGRFVLLAASAIASGTACGNIYLDYDVEFYIPQLELTPTNGFGDKWVGSGSMGTSSFLGTAVASSWNDLPVSISGNVLTFQPGYYSVNANISSTDTTITSFVATSSVSMVYNKAVATTTSASVIVQVGSSSVFTVTLTPTATGISSSTLIVALLPSSATTLSLRRLTQISRLLSLAKEVEQIKNQLTLTADKEADSSGSGECKISRSGETASMSALASGTMGTTTPKIPFANEDYYVVPKRGSQTPLRN